VQAAIDKWLDSAAAIEAGLESWVDSGCQHASDEVRWRNLSLLVSPVACGFLDQFVHFLFTQGRLVTPLCVTQDRDKSKATIEQHLKLIEQQLSSRPYLVCGVWVSSSAAIAVRASGSACVRRGFSISMQEMHASASNPFARAWVVSLVQRFH
jgi:hypothetical protein